MRKIVGVLFLLVAVMYGRGAVAGQIACFDPYDVQACNTHSGSTCTSSNDRYTSFTYVDDSCDGRSGFFGYCNRYTIDDVSSDYYVELVSGNIDVDTDATGCSTMQYRSAYYWDPYDDEWEPVDDDESEDLDWEDTVGDRYGFIEWNDYTPAHSDDSLDDWNYTASPLVRFEFRKVSGMMYVYYAVEVWYEGPE